MQYNQEQQLALQQQAMQQQQEELLQQQQQQQQNQLPQQGPISKDRDFMQWLFNFKEEVVGPLVHIWRGEEEVNPGEWLKQPKIEDRLIIMNEKGITWCTSYIASYINAVYVVSNYDADAMNWTMRKVGRIVWNSLSKRFEEFGLRKIDIPRVANEIISKVHAILLGARGDGFRRFFMSTHHIDEVKTTQTQQQAPRQGGGGLGGLFKKAQPMQSIENIY